MSPPSRDPRRCAELDWKTLEGTFWYPGPMPVSDPPSPVSLRHWDLAKDVCEFCPLRSRCRATSWGEEFGIWGGTDQYDRHKYRHNLVRRLAHMSAEDRAKLAASLYGMRGATGYRIRAIARETGYSAQTVAELVREHVARLKAEREAAGRAAREAIGWSEAVNGEAAA